jgi:hypothetical protein
MLSRRRWDYVPPEPPSVPQGPPIPPSKPAAAANLPESAGDRWRRAVGLPPADGHASDTAAPAERYQASRADAPIPGTSQPGTRQDAFLDYQNRILQEIGFENVGGFQNRPSARDVAAQANRERILKRFAETPYAGDLLANGKIRFDNRDLTPEQWEVERFKTAS